jgi:hypothetical protein
VVLSEITRLNKDRSPAYIDIREAKPDELPIPAATVRGDYHHATEALIFDCIDQITNVGIVQIPTALVAH